MKNFFTLIVLFVLSCVGHGVDAQPRLYFKYLKTTDGLPGNTVRHIYQDSKGFLWFGTTNGLSRYDGHTFMNFHTTDLDVSDTDRVALSDDNIFKVMEDPHGFLWIGTSQRQFSCYDLERGQFVDYVGATGDSPRPEYLHIHIASDGDVWLWDMNAGLRQVTHHPDRSLTSFVYSKELGTLPDNRVRFAYEDTSGRIWIGTRKGLASIYRKESTVENVAADFFGAATYGKDIYFLTKAGDVYVKAAGSQALQQVKSLRKVISDKRCSVTGLVKLSDKWVILTNKGAYDFHFQTRDMMSNKRFPILDGRTMKDNRGDYWVYNNSGHVYYVCSHTGQIKEFDLTPKETLDIIGYERYRVIHDSQGIVWISTYGNGLFAYNPAEDTLDHFTAGTDKGDFLSSNYLLYLQEDRAGGVWVSIERSGLVRLTGSDKGVRRIMPGTFGEFDRSNMVRMLAKDAAGSWLVGTNNGRLYDYDSTFVFKQRTQELPANAYVVEHDTVGTSWIGTKGGGLRIGDTWYKRKPSDSASLTSNDIYSIHRDRKGRMWVGTFEGGLYWAQPDGKGKYAFRRFGWQSYGLNSVRVIQEDADGTFWLGTSGGIYVIDPDSLIAGNEGICFSYNNRTFCSNEIRCICPDGKGGMWVGTSGTGFAHCRLSSDKKRLEYERFDTDNGLVHDVVFSILSDNRGKLWIATEYGMSRFDPQTHSFENYFFSSYTSGNTYCENTAYAGKDGKLYFGTDYGLTVIDPASIPDNEGFSPVVLTGLYINGDPVAPGDKDSPLEKALPYSDKIVLKHYQNSLLIDFSIFDYNDNGQTKYKYWLEHYEKDWNASSNQSSATYRYLPPGNYKFHVKASNRVGTWDTRETVLEIIVKPPFWKSNWAILIYLLLIAVVSYLAYRIISNFNGLRTRIRVEEQLTEYKLVFFTNISHEFRTPLTLIRGALDRIKESKSVPMEIESSLHTMDKSTKRMLRLINQLLTFRKMQSGKLALSLEETDVIAFLYEIYLSFGDMADQKRMSFRFLPSVPSYKMFVDKENIDKVVYNLLSNAFKYTPSGGSIELLAEVDEERKQLRIRVTDTGVGIPKEKQGELFKRFMQSYFSRDSIGVGLHLTHELVTLHKGTIAYGEHPGGGSEFTVCLPADKQAYEETDFMPVANPLLQEEEEEIKTVEQEQEQDTATPPFTPEQQAELEKAAGPLNQRKILIIEDDADVRQFLKEEISVYFQVETAEDGLAGLETAQSYEPDLIVCDVMMPGMNGFEVTKRLKNKFSTSHIPIILLTALNSIEKQTEGIDSGADAYIAKPFSTKFLLTRIFRLIEQREKLREKFTNEPGMVHTAMYTTDRDREFVDRMNALLESNMTRFDFSIDEFAQLMKLSRTVFYKKVKGITGYTPVEYLRIVRMKKAAELLLSPENLTVAEVSYRVGINDPFYFSKCFKAQFGISPSVYQKGGEGAKVEKGDKKAGDD